MKTQQRISAAAIAFVTCLSACTSSTPSTSSAPSADASASSASANNSCINPTQIRKQTIVSDQDIQFELNTGDVWVNHLPRACSGLKFQQGFTWEVHGTLVCSNKQMIRVKDEGTICALGEFTRAPPAAS
jgi:hypothetical protein